MAVHRTHGDRAADCPEGIVHWLGHNQQRCEDNETRGQSNHQETDGAGSPSITPPQSEQADQEDIDHWQQEIGRQRPASLNNVFEGVVQTPHDSEVDCEHHDHELDRDKRNPRQLHGILRDSTRTWSAHGPILSNSGFLFEPISLTKCCRHQSASPNFTGPRRRANRCK
jgi:hypothetical protein